MQLRMLDLFCGAGGAAVGYHRAFTAAGFDVDITGVDIKPQPHYPFAMRVGDAMEWNLTGFDFIHASPPCQGYSVTQSIRRNEGRTYPKLIEPMRTRLQQLSIPWIIENVRGAGAHMGAYTLLCGTQFGLKVYRHRLFESNRYIMASSPCAHPRYLLPGFMCVAGHHAKSRSSSRYGNQYSDYTIAEAREGMGIDWMTQNELAQAVPPAYTEWLGIQIAAVLKVRAA